MSVNMDNTKTKPKSSKSRKRAWKPVSVDNPSFFAGDMEGFVSLEILEDYDLDTLRGVQRNTETSGKRPQKANESYSEESIAGKPNEEDDSQSTEPKKKKRKKMKKDKKKKKKNESARDDQAQMQQASPAEGVRVDMGEWAGLGVDAALLQALEDQGFSSPTLIQAMSLPPAIHFRQDIIGAAETGSGKTLAFGIPVLQHILKSKQQTRAQESKLTDSSQEEPDQDPEAAAQKEPMKVSARTEGGLLALVMTPTRELALQVKGHLQQAAKHTPIRVTAVVGGMAPQKQQRLLKQRPEIVVATPGRLWELMSENEEHLSDLKYLGFLVIDEADRMVEQGHFQELTSILDFIKSSRNAVGRQEEEEGEVKRAKKRRIQKFIFSATLALPKSFRKRGKEHRVSKEETLASLIDKVGLDKKTCKVLDVTNKKGTVDTLTEAQITCSKEEKDVYLYYFLLRYPGRTLVFANTIDCVRRLASILRLLERCPWPLHASMQQRQRLKNLDRFKASDTGLLLATDVAARGLDIPDVQHVIHYQVPKDPELYIHRSGRTARASREGLSVVLVGADDAASYKGIMRTLNSGNELQPFPVDAAFIPGIKKRLKLAKEIDKEELRLKRKHTNNNWLLASAKAMDIEVDDDLLEDLGDSKEKKDLQSKLRQQKAALSSLLETSLLPVGFSGKYPTKSGRLVVPGIEDNSVADKTKQIAVDAVKRKKKGRTQ